MARQPLARVLMLCSAFVAAALIPVRADLASDLARISVEAAGGVKAHEELHSFRAFGVTRVGDKEASFLLHAARPNRLRIETLGARGTLMRAFDGVHAPWKREGFVSPPRRLGEEEEREFLRETEFDQPLYDWERRGVSLDYAGEATVDGRLCYKLLAVFKLTQSVTLFLDAETHLIVRREETRRLKSGREIVVANVFSRFEPVAGVLLPRKIETIVDGELAYETQIQAIVPNPDLPADYFSPPAEEWPKR